MSMHATPCNPPPPPPPHTHTCTHLQAGSHCCWETVVGQELYKLTMVNFLTDIAFIVIHEGGRWLFSTRLFIPCSKPNKLYHEWVRVI